MDKRIEFYSVKYDIHPVGVQISTEDKLKSDFIKSLIASKKKESKHVIKTSSTGDSTISIEILEIDEYCMFGIIGKSEDIKDGILKRIRTKQDNREENDDIKELEKYCLENYTYFYLRFSDFICAVMSNNQAPKFRTHFSHYLNDIVKNHHFYNLAVINLIDANLAYKINQIKNITDLKLIFDASSNLGNKLLNLSDSFHVSQTSIREAKISISLNMSVVTDEAKAIFKDNEMLKKDFNKLIVSGLDENNEEIQMELIEQLLSKKVFIDIDENYLKAANDLDKIKEALSGSLNPT